jgi:SNF2 family DNA or RNA helicase
MSWLNQLWPEQRKAFKFIIARPSTALFSTQGTGKTFIAMALLEHLQPKLALVVAPLTSLDTTWSPRLATLGMHIERNLRFMHRDPSPTIVLTNPEQLRSSAKRLARLPWDVVIWDESQNTKDRTSANARAARRFRFAKHRLALSGTPIDESPIDVWSQMRFVDCGVFGEDWKDFAEEFCTRGGWMGNEWIFRTKKLPDFLKRLENHIFRLTKDFMKLKPITFTPIPIEMFGRQERLYNEMLRDDMIRINGTVIAAANRGVRDVKLAQIAGGFVLDEDGIAHRTGMAKERKFKYLLPQLTPPIVVFCQYLHEVEAVKTILDLHFKRTAVLRGSVKGDDRTRILNEFQSNRLDAIVCQTRTGGVSIEFTASSTLVLYSINYSYIDFEQIIARLHRGGQDRQVNVFSLYCINTIDEEKISAIQRKSETVTEVVSHFERRK